MPGGFHIHVARRPGSAVDYGGPTKPQLFAHGNLRIWASEPSVSIDEHTVLIGHLFRKGPASRRVTDLQGIGSEKLLADRGRALLAEYWGGYVLVHESPDGRIAVFRDPSGILPCYVRSGETGVTIAGDVTDLAKPGPGRVDFREVARLLASGDGREGRSVA